MVGLVCSGSAFIRIHPFKIERRTRALVLSSDHKGSELNMSRTSWDLSSKTDLYLSEHMVLISVLTTFWTTFSTLFLRGRFLKIKLAIDVLLQPTSLASFIGPVIWWYTGFLRPTMVCREWFNLYVKLILLASPWPCRDNFMHMPTYCHSWRSRQLQWRKRWTIAESSTSWRLCMCRCHLRPPGGRIKITITALLLLALPPGSGTLSSIHSRKRWEPYKHGYCQGSTIMITLTARYLFNPMSTEHLPSQ